MGNLHDGHLELVRVAQKRCKSVIATIFVNPLQFGPSEDFDSYPRVLEADAQHLQDVQTDILFAPSLDEMYPDGQDAHTTVSVTWIDRRAVRRESSRALRRRHDGCDKALSPSRH